MAVTGLTLIGFRLKDLEAIRDFSEPILRATVIGTRVG